LWGEINSGSPANGWLKKKASANGWFKRKAYKLRHSLDAYPGTVPRNYSSWIGHTILFGMLEIDLVSKDGSAFEERLSVRNRKWTRSHE
jgi:hypothetical protein